MILKDSSKTKSPTQAILLWALWFLFLLRVVGQAIQYWLPLPSLPSFDAFQGSSLAYPMLLSIQLLILALMIRTSWRVTMGSLAPNHRWGVGFAWFGGVYMTGSLLRIVVGWMAPDAAAWFRAWIPAFFHLVLAAFVLTLASFHLRASELALRRGNR